MVLPNSATSPVRLFDLTQLEYANLRQQLVNLISFYTPYWTEYHDTDPGMVILSLLASCTDLTQFMLELRANELFLSRATMRSSIQDIGRMFDYTLPRMTAPLAELVIMAKPDQTVEGVVEVPIGTQVSTDSGVAFVSERLGYFDPERVWVLRAGSGAPSVDLGAVGDFYVDVTAKRLYGPKVTAGYGSGSLLAAVTGDLLTGSVPPTGSTGVNGDFYLDLAAKLLYGPKADGYWPAGSAVAGTGPSLVLPVYQGQLVSDTFTATGELLQDYQLTGKGLAANFLHVDVGGVPWAEETFVPPQETSARRYLVTQADDGTFAVEFNGYRFDVPASGVAVEVTSLATRGTLGNVLAGSLTKLTQHVTGGGTPDGLDPDVFRVWNPYPSAGAADAADWRDIREVVPRYLSTLWRIVTLQDFIDVAQQVPGVYSANAWQDGQQPLLAHVAVQTSPDNRAASEEFLATVQAFLQRFMIMGTQVQVRLCREVLIDVTLEVVADQRASQVAVEQSLRASFADYFSAVNRPIGELLRLNDLYILADLAEGVQFVTVPVFRRQGASTAPGNLQMGSYEAAALGTLTVSITAAGES